jgi:hypothetical protein
VEEITFGGKSDSEIENKEKQSSSISKRDHWKNVLSAQIIDQNALSNINR